MRAGILLAALLLAACGQAPDIGNGDDTGDDDPDARTPDAGIDAVPADAVIPTVPPEVETPRQSIGTTRR